MGESDSKWKSDLFEKASAAFQLNRIRKNNYMRLVYADSGDKKESNQSIDPADNGELGGLFQSVVREAKDYTDCCAYDLSENNAAEAKNLRFDWQQENVIMVM